MTDIDQLIAKLETAPKGSRKLDLVITKAMGWCDKSAWYDADGDCLQWNEMHPFGSTVAAELMSAPLHAFTTSIDAALTLVPEGWCWECSKEEVLPGALGQCWPQHCKGSTEFFSASAPTPALALCIAALKARNA